MKAIRHYLSVFGFLAVGLGAPHLAHATGESCTNDIDCTTDPSCGGEVCDWTKGHTCQPATATGSGQEGWCTANTDCKCAAEGATCAGVYCTKTVDASAAGGSGGTAGAGTAGAGTAGAGTAGAGTAGAGTAGAGTAGAGTAGAGAGKGSSTATAGASSGSDDSSSGGCSISEHAPKNSLGALLGAVCAATLLGSRRRRRVA